MPLGRVPEREQTEGKNVMFNRYDDWGIRQRRRRLQTGTRIAITALLIAALFYFLFLMPLPYYIFMPGSAEELRPMVSVKQGAAPEKGTFMLTTVGVTDANVVGYIAAQFNSKYELYLKSAIRQNGESEKEYSQRQAYSMHASQSSAIQAAYNKLGIPYQMETDYIEVLQVKAGLPAADVLQAGDIIVSVDGKPVRLYDELRGMLDSKKAGDTIELAYKRNQVTRTATIALAELPSESGQQAGKAGLGIVLAQMISVKADQPEKQVEIKAGDIGGPSAGLMFSLEIYNQLAGKDITKGYRIAGTGEIDAQGHVGVIGGIQHKVVAADREKADIFFAPKDLVPKEGEKFAPVPNASDAKRQAEAIHTKMTVVPVGTIDDALAYLESLPPKSP